MPFRDLSPAELEIVRRCLEVAAFEPSVFPDREFHTIFGVNRPIVQALARQWPDLDETDLDVYLALNNAMNNVLGYPHRWHANWPEHFAFSREQLFQTFYKWKGEIAPNYVEGME